MADDRIDQLGGIEKPRTATVAVLTPGRHGTRVFAYSWR
jgi:hypothetical protein